MSAEIARVISIVGERRIIIGSTDVKALYPSLAIEFAVDKVCQVIRESSIQLQGLWDTKDFIVNRIENGKYHVINLLFISLFTPNNEILGLLCSKWRPPNFRCKQHLLNIVHTLGNRLITSSCKHLAQ